MAEADKFYEFNSISDSDFLPPHQGEACKHIATDACAEPDKEETALDATQPQPLCTSSKNTHLISRNDYEKSNEMNQSSKEQGETLTKAIKTSDVLCTDAVALNLGATHMTSSMNIAVSSQPLHEITKSMESVSLNQSEQTEFRSGSTRNEYNVNNSSANDGRIFIKKCRNIQIGNHNTMYVSQEKYCSSDSTDSGESDSSSEDSNSGH